MLFFYGVHKYGTSNYSVRDGTCEICGEEGKLVSFDAVQFFHIYWIPLIPLGRVHVIDQCKHCNQHLTGTQREISDAQSGGSTPVKFKKVPMPIILFILPLIIVLAVLGIYAGGGIYAGMAREVWLVNGSNVPYQVKIDNEIYSLKSYETQRIKLPMGEHDAQIINSLIPMELFSFEYFQPFIKRFSDKATLILNPDGMAFLIQESMPYTKFPTLNRQNAEYSFCFGEKWYELHGIDFPFRELPSEVRMDSDIELVYKVGIELYQPESYINAISVMQDNGGEELSFYAQNSLSIDPDNRDAIWLLGMVISSNDVSSSELLQAGLSRRPILIDWHRFYQDLIKNCAPENDLLTKYQSLFDAEAGSPASSYLLGRIVDNKEKARSLYLSSESTEEGMGYGYHAISYGYLCGGAFDKAFEYASKAMERNPKNNQFYSTLFETQLATKQYQLIIERLRKEQQDDPGNVNLIAQEIRYQSLPDQIQSYARKKSTSGSSQQPLSKLVENAFYKRNGYFLEEEKDQLAEYFQLIRYHAEGNIDAYLTILNSLENDTLAFERAIYDGNVIKAFDLIKKEGTANLNSFLIAYCAARFHKQETVSNMLLRAVLGELEGFPRLQRSLTGEELFLPENFKSYEMLPEDKKVFACALGYIYPEEKNAFFQISRDFNYSPFFPHHLINKWTGLD